MMLIILFSLFFASSDSLFSKAISLTLLEVNPKFTIPKSMLNKFSTIPIIPIPIAPK